MLCINVLSMPLETLRDQVWLWSLHARFVYRCLITYLDKHCIELVEKYKLSKHLLDLFQRTENATFQYAILGCLKHLCLPKTNKPLIGNENCIQIVSSTLDQSKDMLKRNQFLSIGIIKLLCTGNCKYQKHTRSVI
jgi:hypothetical protein